MFQVQKEIGDQYRLVMGKVLGVLVMLPESAEKDALRKTCEQFFDKQWCLNRSSHPADIEEVSKILAKADSQANVLACNRSNNAILSSILYDIGNSFDCRGVNAVTAQPTIQSTVKEGKLMKDHICPVCGSEFQSNRQDAKFCGVKCKQAAYRERKKTL